MRRILVAVGPVLCACPKPPVDTPDADGPVPVADTTAPTWRAGAVLEVSDTTPSTATHLSFSGDLRQDARRDNWTGATVFTSSGRLWILV
jgi:hypothetical protein